MPEYTVEMRNEDIARKPHAALNDNTGFISPYAALLGQKAWRNLPASIRARFSDDHRAQSPVLYRGYAVSTKYNWLGFLLAQCLRCIGAPLPLEQGHTDTAASVIISSGADGNTQYWTRRYERPGKFPQIIQSAKKFSGPTGLGSVDI